MSAFLSTSRWVTPLVLALACGPDSPAPTTPNLSAGGVPGWRKCFDAGGTPVRFGAPFPLAGGGSGALAATQVAVVQFELNSSCGVRVAPGEVGFPLTSDVRDNLNTAAGSTAAANALLAAGAVALVGGGASVTGPPAAQLAVVANVPFGANQSAADAMSGCTAAELADPTVTKSPTPVWGVGQCWNNRGLVFRTTATGFSWGTSGATYARTAYPALTTAAIVYRNDDFGQPNRDGLRAQFVALGGTVAAEAGFLPGLTVDQFKTLLITVTAGNPSVILGSAGAAALRTFTQAYVALRDDPTWTAKPSNFNSLRFVWTSTLTGNDYSAIGANAINALVTQNDFVQPAWDPTSPAFQNWFAVYQAYDPTAQPPGSGFIPGAYDAAIVMALAITAAGTTEGAAVAAKIREVANPPGVVICPGQWRKAFRFLAKGKDINYEGALGPVDLDERGNPTGLAFGIFRVQPGGVTSAQVSNFGFPPHPVCEDDDGG
jgi:ABC-type branched-subunit amino acid transport system substrate-binding protein